MTEFSSPQLRDVREDVVELPGLVDDVARLRVDGDHGEQRQTAHVEQRAVRRPLEETRRVRVVVGGVDRDLAIVPTVRFQG